MTTDIAIVGMAYRYPSQKGEDIWKIISEKQCLKGDLPEYRKEQALDYFYSTGSKANYKFASGAYLEDIDTFDAQFFKIPPRDAQLMDPSHRLFMETAYHALEDAGMTERQLKGSNTGIYVGNSPFIDNNYGLMEYAVDKSMMASGMAGNVAALLPSRIAYFFDLKGPSILINAGDASGLTAFYQACKGIADGDCETALVGAVSVKYFPACVNPKEDDWDGEGMCVFVLKSLNKALKDNNRIYAVVKGSAMRQDSVVCESDSTDAHLIKTVIQEAWNEAGIKPEDVGFIQRVGSANKEIEKLELAAIEDVLSEGKDNASRCESHSIRNIFGNQHEVSGLTAVLAGVLSLKNMKSILKTCGVSGVNEDGSCIHIVLAAPEDREEKRPNCCGKNLFVLSAVTQKALLEMVGSYIDYLETTEDSLEFICYTQQVGKQHFPYRLAVLCENKKELIYKLKAVLEKPDIADDEVLTGNYKIVPVTKQEKEEFDITTQQQREFTSASRSYVVHEGRQKASTDDLIEIAKYYVIGAEVPFEELYKNESYSTVKTPGYAFEREHMWFPTEGRNLYEVNWKPLEISSLQESKASSGENWMIVQCGESECLSQIESLLERNRIEYHIQSIEESVKVENMFSRYSRILFDVTAVPNYVDDNQDVSNYYTMLTQMYQVLKQFAKANEGRQAYIEIVGKDAFAVEENKAGNPFQCSMLSFAKSVAKDCTDLTCNGIDIDSSSLEDEKADDLILSTTSHYILVMRDGKLYQQVFSECEWTLYDTYHLRKDGIYLVAGGVGGIGRTIAAFLASQEKINLALFSRRSLPQQELWETIRDSKETSPSDKALLEDLCRLSKKANKVEIISCDISDEEQLKTSVAQLKEKYGQINGVVHSAGVSKDISILKRGEELLNDAIVKPKIQGTINLHKATLQEPLQFFITFSSIATIFTSLGQTDYVAANTFLDEFTLYRRSLGLPASTVNWCTWKDKGMAHDSGFIVDTIFKAMESDAAIKGFHKAFMSTLPRVTIGYLNQSGGIGLMSKSNVTLSGRLKDNVEKYRIKLESRRAKATQDAGESFTILGRSDGNYSETEIKIAKIFGEKLGFKEMNIFDDFYELGVDSISGMEIIDEVNERMNLEISIVDMLEYSKLHDFCEFVDEEIEAKKEPEQTDIQLIDDYIEITDEDTDEDMEYVLSPSQKGIYLLNKIQEESTNYNLSSLVVMSRNFEIDKVQKAVGGLLRRHEVFRTSFHDRDGELYQKIHKKVKFKVESEHVKDDEIMDQIPEIYDNFLKPFDLSQAPLFRMKVLYTDKGRCFVMYDIHHIITDGISNEIIYKDILALLKGEQLPPLDYTYKEYCVWMDERLRSGVLQPHEDYWLDLLKGDLPLIDLPTKRGRTNIPSYAGAHAKFHLGLEDRDKLVALAKEHKTTLFNVLLACLDIVLYKYSGQKDIIIGSPIMGRNNRKCKNIIGMFVNTMVLRNNVEPEKTIGEFIEQIRKNTLEAIRHAEYPFSYIVEKLDGKRDMSRNAVFDIMFVLQNYNREKVGMDYFGFEDLDESLVSNKASKFDISFCAIEEEKEIAFDVEYSTFLFADSTIQNMIDDFCTLVGQLDNDNKIGTLNILHEEEYQLVTSGFSSKTCVIGETDTINDYLERAVSQYAEKIAIIYYDQEITYKEFGEKVNKLAGFLRTNYEVKCEDVVGLYQDKTIDTLISLFAIWKAGAAFLPLDKTYPKERIDFMLDATKCKVVLVNCESSVLDDAACSVLDVRNVAYEELSAEVTSINKPGDLAYIMFTSGSTGNPKGVMVEHRNLLAFVNGFYEEFGRNDDVVMLQQYSYTFDGFNEEVYTTLFSGSTLVMADKNDVLDMAKLDILITKYQINTLSCSALLFQQIGKYIHNPNLRTVISGGDVMKLEYVKSYPKEVALYNSYGPTEATCVATYYRVTREEENSIPIGKSLANYKLYILDEYGLPRPIGVPGEIYIGGMGVSRGYLNDESLTNEFFSYREEYQDRLYKTGDIGRWTEDGNIEFLGRDDRQIKIRGFRIEISEIEKYLFQYEGIEETCIQPVELAGREKQLCCYLKAKASVDVQEVRKYLRARLPEYMVPTYYVLVEAFPLNQNGKVDVKKLPLPDRNSVTDSVYVAPRSNLEEQLVKIIEDVLGVEKIGVEDNFFDMGVNSIKAIEIINRMVESGFVVDINDLLEKQDVASLAKHISKNGGNYFDEFIDYLKESAAEDSEESHRRFLEDEEAQGELARYEKATKAIGKLDLLSKNNYRGILLLGSTGYLGSYILNELLTNTDAHLYLIVRGKDAQQALERVKDKYLFYFGEELQGKKLSRIHAYAGDTTKNEFGLQQNEYNEISQNINCIVNSAAIVKHNGNYNEFLGVNVDTVKHCIALAKIKKDTAFHHISTISVGSGYIEDTDYAVFTEFTGNINQIGDNNYVNSKIEAEKLIEEARKEGLNITVYRVGNLVGNSKTGRFQTNIGENAFYNILKSVIALGKVPKDTGITVDFSFVDYVAKGFALLCLRRFASGKNIHLYNPRQVQLEEVAEFIKLAGYEMEIIPLNDFLDFVKDNLQNKKYSEAISNLLIMTGILNKKGNGTNFYIRNDYTVSMLGHVRFKWKDLDKEIMQKMLAYCEEIHFIKKEEDES